MCFELVPVVIHVALGRVFGLVLGTWIWCQFLLQPIALGAAPYSCQIQLSAGTIPTTTPYQFDVGEQWLYGRASQDALGKTLPDARTEVRCVIVGSNSLNGFTYWLRKWESVSDSEPHKSGIQVLRYGAKGELLVSYDTNAAAILNAAWDSVQELLAFPLPWEKKWQIEEYSTRLDDGRGNVDTLVYHRIHTRHSDDTTIIVRAGSFAATFYESLVSVKYQRLRSTKPISWTTIRRRHVYTVKGVGLVMEIERVFSVFCGYI
jgi:hypothetical protein